MAKAKKLSPLEQLTNQYSNHPVYQVVQPMRVDAMQAAKEWAQQHVARVMEKLAAHDNDFNAAYPYPRHAFLNYAEQSMKRDRVMANMVITSDRSRRNTGMPGAPYYVIICPDRSQRFIDDTIEQAAEQHDLFVLKLVRKIGECLTAEIDGNHVWRKSVIRVEKDDPEGIAVIIEHWQTRQIVNVSKLGKYFNQFPTRLLKR